MPMRINSRNMRRIQRQTCITHVYIWHASQHETINPLHIHTPPKPARGASSPLTLKAPRLRQTSFRVYIHQNPLLSHTSALFLPPPPIRVPRSSGTTGVSLLHARLFFRISLFLASHTTIYARARGWLYRSISADGRVDTEPPVGSRNRAPPATSPWRRRRFLPPAAFDGGWESACAGELAHSARLYLPPRVFSVFPESSAALWIQSLLCVCVRGWEEISESIFVT